MADIDQMLRESFHRLAEPGDPTGVAQAVRARVEAGDVGTPSDSGPGFGGGTFDGGGWPWILGAGTIAGIGGLVLGASGILGASGPSGSAEPPRTSAFSVGDSTPGLDCPGGVRVASFHPGDRVLAVARSADGGWLAVRNPVDRARTVWVALDELVLDGGQPEVASLEVDGCPAFVAGPLPTDVPEPEAENPGGEDPEEPEVPPAGGGDREDPPRRGPTTGPTMEPPTPPTKTTEPPTPPSKTEPPTQTEPPPPPTDTTGPTLSNLTVSAGEVWCESTLAVTVDASDDTAVTRVELTISGSNVPTSSVDMKSGEVQNQWTHEYTAPSWPYASVHVTFRVRAFDAAGNPSPERSVGAVVKCLI